MPEALLPDNAPPAVTPGSTLWRKPNTPPVDARDATSGVTSDSTPGGGAGITSAAGPRWLDRQLAGRLSIFFGGLPADPPSEPSAVLPGGLCGALRLWQWERLCATLLAAARNSLQYRERLGEQAAGDMIRETGGALAGIWLEREAAVRAGCVPAVTEEGPAIADTINAAGTGGPDEQRAASVSLFTANEAAEAAQEAGTRLERLLSRLPFTLPGELAAAPESFLAVPHDAVEGVISLPTSGTTGKGKRIYCSPSDLAETAAFFRHGMRFMVRPCGLRAACPTAQPEDPGTAAEALNTLPEPPAALSGTPSSSACMPSPASLGEGQSGQEAGRADHVVLLMSGERPGSVGDLLLRGMRGLGVTCSVAGFVPPGDAAEDAMMERLTALASTCIVGTPAQLFSLSRHAKARLLRLTSVLLSGDAMPDALRRGIEAGFGCPVFAHYGLTECGLGGAVECGERRGCHMREADLLHEIVDGEGGPLPPGVWGEIAITTLTREAMPLLRYKTGDEGRILAEPCACGSVFGRIEVRDRLSRRIPLPDGGYARGVTLDEALFVLPGLKSYAAVVHRDAQALPCGLLVELAIVPGTDGETLASKARAALQAVPELAGLPVTVRTREPGGGSEPRLTQAKMRVTESRAPFPQR